MHYDLVITDIRMPEMNGLRLYQCLKNIDPAIKVIFVTALDAANELVSVISPGPVKVLKKPVDKQLFSKSVKAALQAAN
jgi:DNA-binding NarL/FixJ family response regulator